MQADQLDGRGFREDVSALLSHVGKKLPGGRQTVSLNCHFPSEFTFESTQVQNTQLHTGWGQTMIQAFHSWAMAMSTTPLI